MWKRSARRRARFSFTESVFALCRVPTGDTIPQRPSCSDFDTVRVPIIAEKYCWLGARAEFLHLQRAKLFRRRPRNVIRSARSGGIPANNRDAKSCDIGERSGRRKRQRNEEKMSRKSCRARRLPTLSRTHRRHSARAKKALSVGCLPVLISRARTCSASLPKPDRRERSETFTWKSIRKSLARLTFAFSLARRFGLSASSNLPGEIIYSAISPRTDRRRQTKSLLSCVYRLAPTAICASTFL